MQPPGAGVGVGFIGVGVGGRAADEFVVDANKTAMKIIGTTSLDPARSCNMISCLEFFEENMGDSFRG